MIESGWVVKSIASAGLLSTFLQAVIPVADASYVDQISKLGTQAILAIAVVVLWKKLQEKDKLLMENYKGMVDAAGAIKVSMEKMEQTLESMKDTIDSFATARSALSLSKRD